MQKMLMAFGQMDPWTAGYVVVGLALILVLMAAYALKNAEEDPDECDCTPEHIILPPPILLNKAARDRFNDEDPAMWNARKVKPMTDLEAEAARSEWAMWAEIEERAMNTDPEAY